MTDGNGLGLEDVPPGVPGRVYICEWCGKYTNNFQPYGEMKFCPHCGKAMLRKDCPKCGAPIPVPPQIKCLACGEWLTMMPMTVDPQGNLVHSADAVQEPDKDHRQQLEVKGNNWYDVVRGKAEGPDPELPDIAPPSGWTPEEFARLMQQAGGLGDIEAERTVWCDHCHIKLRYFGTEEKLAEVVCQICAGPVRSWPFVDGEQPQPPTPDAPPNGEGLDNGPATG